MTSTGTSSSNLAELRPRPRVDPDSASFWAGAESGQLTLPRCASCDRWQFPPREQCADCGGQIRLVPHSGRGTVYSYIVMHHSAIQGFDDQLPFSIALVEFEEGVRVPARVVGPWDRASLIGSDVQAEFEHYAEGVPPALVVRLLSS